MAKKMKTEFYLEAEMITINEIICIAWTVYHSVYNMIYNKKDYWIVKAIFPHSTHFREIKCTFFWALLDPQHYFHVAGDGAPIMSQHSHWST